MQALTESDLAQFYGTQNYYRHSLNHNFLYTDGVQYVAENGGAYWLLDEIAIANMHFKKLQVEEFQSWTLTREGTKAVLTCTDGNDRMLYVKMISFTDFPLEKIEFFFENNVLCLPRER